MHKDIVGSLRLPPCLDCSHLQCLHKNTQSVLSTSTLPFLRAFCAATLVFPLILWSTPTLQALLLLLYDALSVSVAPTYAPFASTVPVYFADSDVALISNKSTLPTLMLHSLISDMTTCLWFHYPCLLFCFDCPMMYFCFD